MTDKDLPYTLMIKNRIIQEIEKMNILAPNSTANGEFQAGTEYSKKEIIKKIKETNLT